MKPTDVLCGQNAELLIVKVGGQSVYCLAIVWMTGIQSLAEEKSVSSGLCVHTRFKAHPASFPMGTRGPFSGGKAQAGCGTDHAPPSIDKVENE
jgi:hypothetical protein